MTDILIQIPDHIFIALNEDKEELSRQIKLFSAIAFFKKHKLTLKQAADFAAYPLPAFIHELNVNKVDVVAYDPAELEKEMDIFKEC